MCLCFFIAAEWHATFLNVSNALTHILESVFAISNEEILKNVRYFFYLHRVTGNWSCNAECQTPATTAWWASSFIQLFSGCYQSQCTAGSSWAQHAAFKDMSGASPFNLSSAFFCIEGERGKELKQTFTDPFWFQSFVTLSTQLLKSIPVCVCNIQEMYHILLLLAVCFGSKC